MSTAEETTMGTTTHDLPPEGRAPATSPNELNAAIIAVAARVGRITELERVLTMVHKLEQLRLLTLERSVSTTIAGAIRARAERARGDLASLAIVADEEGRALAAPLLTADCLPENTMIRHLTNFFGGIGGYDDSGELRDELRAGFGALVGSLPEPRLDRFILPELPELKKGSRTLRSISVLTGTRIALMALADMLRRHQLVEKVLEPDVQRAIDSILIQVNANEAEQLHAAVRTGVLGEGTYEDLEAMVLEWLDLLLVPGSWIHDEVTRQALHG